jgi:hypothetical protein
MFTKDGKAMKKSLVKALHGLQSFNITDEDIRPSSLEQRIAILKLAVFKANSRCQTRKKSVSSVSSDDAAWAYRVIHKCDPTEGKLLRDWTMEFGEALTAELEVEYLDVARGFTPSIHSAGDCPVKDRPSVTTYKAKESSCVEEGNQFCVWHASNCFSPEFVNKLFGEYNEAPFFDANAIAAGAGKQEKQKVQRAARYGRAVSFGEEPIAMEVKGKFQPPTSSSTPCEQELLEAAYELAQLQGDYIRKHVGAQVPLTFACNLLHVVAGSVRSSSYGTHDDVSDMTTSKEGSPIWMNEEESERLPTNSELQTLTWYFCNLDDDACEIHWSPKKDLQKKVSFVNQKTNQTVNKLKLGKCGAHWQGPGSQSSYQHEINALGKVEGAARIIVSCRFSVDRGFNPEKYNDLLSKTMKAIPSEEDQRAMYCHTNVWKHLTEGGCQPIQLTGISNAPTNNPPSDGCVTASTIGTTTHNMGSASQGEQSKAARPSPLDSAAGAPPPKHQKTSPTQQQAPWKPVAKKEYCLKGKKWNDHFPDLPRDEYEKLDLHRSGKKIKLHTTIEEILLRATWVKRLLLEKGVVAWTKRFDKAGKFKKFIPSLFMNRSSEGQKRLFKIGEKYSGSAIAQMAGGNRSLRQRDLYQPGEQEVLFLSHSYKNDLESVLKAQESTDPIFSIDLANPEAAPKMVREPYLVDGEMLYVYGSGGSATEQGIYAPNISRTTNESHNIIIPPHQNLHDGGINEGLDAIATRKGVVAVFSEFQNFNKGHAPAKQQDGVPLDLVQFLGYYEFVDRTMPVDSLESLKEELKDAPEHVFQWSIFRTRPYIKFHLRRLFSAEEWAALRSREESYPADHQIYRHTPVDERLDSEIPKEMLIPISDSFTWREDVHGEEEAINHCLGGDALDKYVQDSEPGDKIMRSKPSGVGVTIAEDDDGPSSAVLSRDMKGTRGTISQCLDSVLLITQAGFQRIAGRSLTSDVIPEATAKPLEDPSLPLVHRMHAFPLGCRAMDTTNAFIRSEWISYRKKTIFQYLDANASGSTPKILIIRKT